MKDLWLKVNCIHKTLRKTKKTYIQLADQVYILQRGFIMKTITNEGLQSKTLILNKSDGKTSQHWLKPGESIQVPPAWISEQIKNLVARRILKLTNSKRK